MVKFRPLPFFGNDHRDVKPLLSCKITPRMRRRVHVSLCYPRLFPHEARQQSPGEPGAASAAPPVLDSAVLFAWLPGHYLSIRFVLVHGFDPVQFA